MKSYNALTIHLCISIVAEKSMFRVGVSIDDQWWDWYQRNHKRRMTEWNGHKRRWRDPWRGGHNENVWIIAKKKKSDIKSKDKKKYKL
jgi:hypothetical protein